MALSPTYEITPADGGQTATASNDTTYGGANQDRDEAAEYVLWSKTDKNGVRTFYNPEQGNVLTNLEYTLDTSPGDGWYELIRLRIQPYNALSNYVLRQSSGSTITQYESIFYYASTDKVYRSIVNSTGQNPEDTEYFEEVSLEDLQDQINNTNLEDYIQDYPQNYNVNKGLRDRFLDVQCCTAEDRERNRVLYDMKQSADTNFANGYPDRYEKIIRDIEPQLLQA